MSLSYRLAQRALGECQKLGLFYSPKFLASTSTSVDSLGQKKGDWLDEWGKWHVPSRQLEPWPADYKEHPERDLVNFPHPVQKLYEDKVRLGFIPDEWFQFFYKKTGVTGPYLFGWGLVAFLLQKEIWVVEHEFKHLPPLVILTYICYRMWGAKIHKWAETSLNKELDQEQKILDDGKKDILDIIQHEKWSQGALPDVVTHIAEAKKENLGLQLEISYRERLQTAFQEVKRRVDYLAESEEAKRRFEQKHMVNWIVDQVKKSITAKQEQEVLRQCISDLKNMAPA